MPTKSKKSTGSTGKTRRGQITSMDLAALDHEQVRLRAYEIYVAKGAQPGHDMEHWLQAERELSESEINQ